MAREKYIEKMLRHEGLMVSAILLLGVVVRAWGIGGLPRGLNQDEASSLYEAWALLHYGVDRCGNAFPALFVSWGSGQNVLLSYLAMPFVALLGPVPLAIRLPSAILGCATLILFWLYARRAGGKAFGVCALFVLTVAPWHVMISRWALESNLLPALMMAGLLLTETARERPWALLGAAGVFGLSLYAYGTAFFFLPFYLAFAVFSLRRELRPAPFIASLALFVLIALPITAAQAINVLDLKPARLLGITLPRLTQTRQAAVSVLGGGGIGENLRAAAELLLKQNDGLIFNALPMKKGGIFYFFGLPTAVIGFAVSLGKRKDRPREGAMRCALLASLICAGLIRCNINRINMLWLPLIYFSGLGIYVILKKLGDWALLPVLGVLACFAVFISSYCQTFGGGGNANFFPGLGEAISCALETGEGPVYVTDYVNQPYIFALVASETPPEVFVETVEYENEYAAFRQVERFRGFEFERKDACGVLVLGNWETEGRKVLATFGDYSVCTANEE